MKWPYVIVLVLVAVGCGVVAFIFGYFCGLEADTRSGSFNNPERYGSPGLTFFAGLSVGMVMFLVLTIGLVWWHYRGHLERSLDELTTRVDWLQRKLGELQQASRQNAVPISPVEKVTP